MPTPYLLQVNNPFSFEFVTDQGNRYAAYFLDYSYMFAQYPHIVGPIYSFSIDIKEGDADTSIEDERIPITIFEIFFRFFSFVENVAVFVCDSLDNRQLARHRKFNLWFWRFNDGRLIKEDGIAMMDGVPIYNSILIHRSNPEIDNIISAFKELNEEASRK